MDKQHDIENQVGLDEVIRQLESIGSIDPELREIYQEEAEEHLQTMYSGLGQLKQDAGDADALGEIRRASHTLKGAAGAVGVQAVTRLSHRMEDLLDSLAERSDPVSGLHLDLLFATTDQLQELTTGDFELQAVATSMVDLYQRYTAEMGSGTARTQANGTQGEPQEERVEIVRAEERRQLDNRRKSQEASQQYLRVPLDRLNDLVGVLGEMNVNRSEFNHRLSEFESRLDDMQNAMTRLCDISNGLQNEYLENVSFSSASSSFHGDRFGQRTNGFDTLQFEHYTGESLAKKYLEEAESDAKVVAQELRVFKSSFEQLLRRQKQLEREAQNGLMRVRLVPLSGIVSKLERTVRTVANKVGKQVELQIVGERIELDKTVLDDIVDPLLHLLRNAIDHGVEDAASRADVGKSEVATIRLHASNPGTQLTIRISDDGAGINQNRVLAKAIEQGLVREDQMLSENEVNALIFRTGFSTAETLSDVSGRGVGMDVVADAIRRLKGTIGVDSQEGQGTTFTIVIPTNLGMTRAAMIQSAGRIFSIPTQAIEKIERLDISNVIQADGHMLVETGSRSVKLVELSKFFQLGEGASSINANSSIILLSDGPHEVALVVDTVLGHQDVVVKNLGNHLKNVPGFIGATITGDGSIVPILDVGALILGRASIGLDSVPKTKSCEPKEKLAMIVEDSISVRRVTEKFLQSAGWKTVSAKDGVDALEKLAELDSAPSVFLSDMEMPRMDGLELIRQIRELDAHWQTPIVMITSRGSERHRQKAFEAGATDYVVKPYNEEALLSLLDNCVAVDR
jgi:chemosensory pili system protein ChpA (sensor histidine kinase/response regulator)